MQFFWFKMIFFRFIYLAEVPTGMVGWQWKTTSQVPGCFSGIFFKIYTGRVVCLLSMKRRNLPGNQRENEVGRRCMVEGAQSIQKLIVFRHILCRVFQCNFFGRKSKFFRTNEGITPIRKQKAKDKRLIQVEG